MAEMPFSPFLSKTLDVYIIEFWACLLMGSESGNQAYIDVLLRRVFSIVSTKLHLDRQRRFLYEFSL